MATHAEDRQAVTENGRLFLHAGHAAFLYRDHAEYLAALTDFARVGLAHGGAVFVAVPRAQLPPGWALPGGRDVRLADMRQLGQNPARIIPDLRAFADRSRGRRVWYLGEPAWPGRSAAEQVEIARQEALLNLEFAAAQVTMTCLYNASDLPPDALANARCTHPVLLSGGTECQSADYLGPAKFPPGADGPLQAPPASARALRYERDLRPLRALVAECAKQAGLASGRGMDLVLAASEVAANTLRHTSTGGLMRLWRTSEELLCQLEDGGFIADPLAGYRRTPCDMPGGQGLWLVNQVCDLAQIRSGESGTTVRLHMWLP